MNNTHAEATQPAAAQEAVAVVSAETYNSDGTSDIIKPALPIGTKLYAAPVAAAPVDTWFADQLTAMGEVIPLASTPAAPRIDLTTAEVGVIEALLALAYAAWNAADNGEDNGESLTIERSEFAAVGKALDTLDELPDDRPGYVMEAAAKARWALRRVLSAPLIDASPKGGSDVPDMFWNDADPERAFDSIIELVSQEWSNGSVVAGDVMEIQQAIRLPNIKVRIVESEDDGVDYEEAPNTPPVCAKCSGTGFVECGKSGAFVRSGSIQCDCMQATSAEVGA